MRKRWIKAAAAALGMALLLGGCQIGNRDIIVSGTLGNQQVFKIGGMTCGIREARVYLCNYQNIYGTAYGVDLWEHDFGDDSLTEYIKAITLEELTQMVCMNLLAESEEVSLSEEEIKKTGEAAAEYYDSLSEEEIAYMGVTESDIAEYYSHYALAQKLYNSLTDSVNEEVSDDEARVIEIMQMFISDEATATEAEKKLNDGEDFASVANNYNELSSIQVTVCRDDLPDEVEEVAFQLDNGETSGMISVENGYYFIKCINNYNEELTEANKSNIVEKREKEAFDDVYHTYVDGLSSNINEELWNELQPVTDGTITTDSFFEVFEKYCSEI